MEVLQELSAARTPPRGWRLGYKTGRTGWKFTESPQLPQVLVQFTTPVWMRGVALVHPLIVEAVKRDAANTHSHASR
jgi:hypothetical protein